MCSNCPTVKNSSRISPKATKLAQTLPHNFYLTCTFNNLSENRTNMNRLLDPFIIIIIIVFFILFYCCVIGC